MHHRTDEDYVWLLQRIKNQRQRAEILRLQHSALIETSTPVCDDLRSSIAVSRALVCEEVIIKTHRQAGKTRADAKQSDAANFGQVQATAAGRDDG